MSVSVRTVRLGAVGDGSVGKTSLFFACENFLMYVEGAMIDGR